MSKFILSFVYILMMSLLGGFVPNASFAASPFLVKHSSVEQLEQSGQGRAAFVNETSDCDNSASANEKTHERENKTSAEQVRKPVTLAESLVHLRQHQSVGHQHQSTEHQSTQNQSQPQSSSEKTSANQSKKIFLVQPQN